MESKRILNILLIVALGIVLAWIVLKYKESIPAKKSNKNLWVYIELKVDLPRDTTDYFYYGQIKEELVDKINNDEKVSGLFILSNIRYWNDDDLLKVYENEDHDGYKIFQIQAIQYLIPFKDDPINLFDPEELHETALSLRDTVNI